MAEGPSLVRRVVTFRSGRSPGSRVYFIRRALPIEVTTVGSGSRPRLQWRYRGGFSPPSLFSLGGHLNGLCSYVIAEGDDMGPGYGVSRGRGSSDVRQRRVGVAENFVSNCSEVAPLHSYGATFRGHDRGVLRAYSDGTGAESGESETGGECSCGSIHERRIAQKFAHVKWCAAGGGRTSTNGIWAGGTRLIDRDRPVSLP